MNSSTSSNWLSYSWFVVALLFPVAMLNYLDRQMIASMKKSVIEEIPPLYAEQVAAKAAANSETAKSNNSVAEEKQKVENTNWGYMLGLFKWVYAIASPFGGYIADRFSRRITICASLVVWSAITFTTGLVSTFEGLLWTRALMGVSEAFYIPAALALISDFHIGPTRSKAVGMHQMGIYCGVIIGGFSGYVADSPILGWRWAFKWIGLLGVVYAVPLLIGLKEAPRGQDKTRQSWIGSLSHLLLNPSYILLIAYFTLPALAGWVFRDWMPAILLDRFPEIGQGLAGVSAIVWQVAAIVAAIVGGTLADYWMNHNRRGRIYVSAIGMTLLIPALLLVGQATTQGTLLTAVLGLVLFGIGWGFFDCNNMPILCQIAKPELRATGYGLMNMVSISCGGLADKSFGKFKDQDVPTSQVFSVFALICVVSVVLVLLIRPKAIEEIE